MSDNFTRDEVMEKLAGLYCGVYADWFLMMDEAKAAAHDDDDEAFRAITRRADKKSDYMEGIKGAAAALGIQQDEFMDFVRAEPHDPPAETWSVITAAGMDVHTGSKASCELFIDNALRCGSRSGLRIVPTKTWESGTGNA